MASSADWLDAGMELVAEHGSPGLTIERMTERLGLSKGSFYHHFKGVSGFKTALLAHYESQSTTRYIEAVSLDPNTEARSRIRQLIEMVVQDDVAPALELGRQIRAWAAQDAEVREVQERIDRTRLEFLRSLWLEATSDPQEAALVSLLQHLVLVGAAHVIPPVAPQELRRLYEMTERLAPPKPPSPRPGRVAPSAAPPKLYQ